MSWPGLLDWSSLCKPGPLAKMLKSMVILKVVVRTARVMLSIRREDDVSDGAPPKWPAAMSQMASTQARGAGLCFSLQPSGGIKERVSVGAGVS